MNIKKLISTVIAISITAILALHMGVIAYADTNISRVDLKGHSLSGLYSGDAVSTVTNAVSVSYPSSDYTARASLQKKTNGEWSDYSGSTFEAGTYRLALKANSVSGGTQYAFVSEPTVTYNGIACTVSSWLKFSVNAYSPEFYVATPVTRNIIVTNVLVTSANEGDILGDGVFSYDPDTTTLTVNGDCTYNGIIIKNNGVDGLIINVAGASTLKATGATAIHCTNFPTKITGSGWLTVKSDSFSGIYARGSGAVVTIEDAHIAAEGKWGISANGADNEKLVIRHSFVTAVGTDYAIGDFNGGITFDDCKLTDISGNVYKNGTIYKMGGTEPATIVNIEYKEYPLLIAGKTVTDTNAGDILGNGVFSYDADTKTLTVNGDCTCNNVSVISSRVTPGLTIEIAKNCTLSTKNAAAIFYNNANSTKNTVKCIGNSRLTLSSDATGILTAGGSLTVENANISTSGNYGLLGYGSAKGSLVIKNSNISANNSIRAIGNFSDITLEECEITTPSNAVIKDGTIYESNSETIAKNVTIKKTYGLTVAGTGVTEANAGDILGNGIFSYDEDTKTLTVNGIYTYTGGGNLITNESISGLTINVAGDSRLRSYAHCISCRDNDTKITGKGKLELESTNDCGIYSTPGATLTIDNADIDVRGKWGIAGGQHSEKLIIKNSDIAANCTSAAICDFGGGITLDGCYIDIPGSDANKNGSIYSGDTKATYVVIKAQKYGLSIAGMDVTPRNADDILGDGVFRYDDSIKTLYVKGDCTASGNIAIYNTGVSGLTVHVLKDSTLTSAYQTIYSSKDMTITGNGKLTLVSNGYHGILCTGELDFYNIDIDISGKWGIVSSSSNEITFFDNINASINGTEYAIECSDFVLIDNKVISPTNYKSVNNIICDSDGTPAKNVEIHVDEYPLDIAGVTVTSRNRYDVLGNGVFSYSPSQKTLTVRGNDMRMDIGHVITNNGIDGLIISVKEDSVLSSSNGAIIYTKHNNTTITTDGTNTLVLEPTYGAGLLTVTGNLMVENANIIINKDEFGIVSGYPGYSNLTIKNSNITAHGNAPTIKDYISITLDGCEITSPTGAVNKNGTIYESNGETIANNVVITRLGDVNFDGVVNDADAKLILKYISTNKPMYADESNNLKALHSADVDVSGSVDMLDVIKVLSSIR